MQWSLSSYDCLHLDYLFLCLLNGPRNSKLGKYFQSIVQAMHFDCSVTFTFFFNILKWLFQTILMDWSKRMFGGYNTLLGPKAFYYKIKKSKRNCQNKSGKLEGVGVLNKLAECLWNPIWTAGTTWLHSITFIQIHGRIFTSVWYTKERVCAWQAQKKLLKALIQLCVAGTEIHFIYFWTIQREKNKETKHSLSRWSFSNVFSKHSGPLAIVASLGPHKLSLYCSWQDR